MQFLYQKDALAEILQVKDEGFLHLKAQRKRVGEILRVQNFKDNTAYFYEIIEISKSQAILKLKNSQILPKQDYYLRLGWAICDEKTIEKTLPSLNELGVKELVFFYADFSQKNIRLDFNRLNRILISSNEQCGRYEMMSLNLINANELKSENCVLLDFNGEIFDKNIAKNKLILVGAEGGFSSKEREKFKQKISLNCKNILRSSTAITCLAAKILG